MTDPRAALADQLRLPILSNAEQGAAQIERRLAERGVLLVTEPELRRAIHDTLKSDYPGEVEWVAAIFAALSGEAAE